MASDPPEDATPGPAGDKHDQTVATGPGGARPIGVDDTLQATPLTPPDPSRGPRIRIGRPSGQPERLGRYTIVKLLGRGGMGAVFEARDAELDRGVAIKVLRDDRETEELTEGLRREAQALAKLVHPNVVTVYDVGSAQGQLFVVMQLIDGEPIDHWLRAHGAGPADIVAAFREGGRGLSAAHAADLVHCDVKPANVLVDRDGVVRVSDFGLARIGAETAASISGTPRYMAPEQFGGIATAASDQYSFCVALWEVLAGEPPFPDASLGDAEVVRTRTPREMPRSARVPGYVVRALLRGLSADPNDRFPAMDALLHALAPPAWRRWAIGGALGGVALGAAVVATFALTAPAPAVRAPTDADFVALPKIGARRAVTHYGKDVSACTPAFDGDHIVFDRTEQDAVDLYTVALAGGEPRQLTSSPIWEWRANPGRHPGEVIHLLQDPSNATEAKVAYLDTATGHETVAATVNTPDASVIDDGIVYISTEERDLRRLVRGQDIVLAHAPAGHLFHYLAVSHHRDRVAAIAAKEGDMQLCIVDVKTGGNTCAATKALETRPTFGSDDRVLYYNGLDGIHRQVLATGADALIVPDAVSKGGLAVADDGRAIVYSNCGSREQLVDWTTQKVLVDDPDASTPSGATTHHFVWVRWQRGHPVLMAGGDGPEIQLTEPQFGPISEPAMSPNGELVAFRSGPPHSGIYTVTLQPGSAVQRISDNEHDRLPVWIGDDQLAFTRKDDRGIPTVFITASDGAMQRQIPGAGRTAVGGRDHRLLIATNRKLYWIDLVTGRESQGPELNASVKNNAFVATSPDGRWLLVESGAEGQLARMRLDPPSRFEPLAALSSGQTVEGSPSITNDGHVLLAPESWSGNIYMVSAMAGSRF